MWKEALGIRVLIGQLRCPIFR